MDWLDPTTRDPTEEREEDMSSLAVGFAAWMGKREASAQGEATLGFKVSGRKRPKQSNPDEKAQKSLVVTTVDSLERAFFGGCLTGCFQRGLCIVGGWGPNRGAS